MVPKRKASMPPALVAARPPSVALPREGRSMPGLRPCSAAACCRRLERHAGIGDCHPAHRIDLDAAVQAAGADDEAAGRRGRAADEAGAAAMSDHRNPLCMAQRQQRAELVDRARRHRGTGREIVGVVSGVPVAKLFLAHDRPGYGLDPGKRGVIERSRWSGAGLGHDGSSSGRHSTCAISGWAASQKCAARARGWPPDGLSHFSPETPRWLHFGRGWARHAGAEIWSAMGGNGRGIPYLGVQEALGGNDAEPVRYDTRRPPERPGRSQGDGARRCPRRGRETAHDAGRRADGSPATPPPLRHKPASLGANPPISDIHPGARLLSTRHIDPPPLPI